jgi:hypothetical protein
MIKNQMKAVQVTFQAYKELTKVEFKNEFDRDERYKRIDVVRGLLNDMITVYNIMLESNDQELFYLPFSVIVNLKELEKK